MLKRIADGRTDLVFDFVASGHPAISTDDHGVPLIRWCAYYGDVSAIRFLIANGESVQSIGDNLGLNEAAFHGHWRLCQFLIEQGADVNYAACDTGETALHSSLCKANRPAYEIVVQLLLASGANPNIAAKPGVETGQFMRDCRTKAETPLHRAAAFGSEASIDLLLNAGAVCEAMDMHGDTPLAWASWHTRPDSVLKRLCYGEHRIHPDRNSKHDHGAGWGAMDMALLGRPHLKKSAQ